MKTQNSFSEFESMCGIQDTAKCRVEKEGWTWGEVTDARVQAAGPQEEAR